MRIFVLIPAYRDPEVYRTVEDCYTKAAIPSCLRICVLWQRGDDEPAEFPYSDPGLKLNVRTVPIAEAKGLGWARSESAKLCLDTAAAEPDSGPDYVLMLDSHHRFVFGWDAELIRQIRLLPKKSLISAYVQMYTPPESLFRAPNSVLTAQGFNEMGVLTMAYREVPVSQVPLPGFLVSLHFIFAPLKILSEVPFDPEKYFRMEEAVYSVRCWTHGWNIYNPFRAVLFHFYLRTKAPKHWEDHVDWWKIEHESYEKFKMMLGVIPDTTGASTGTYGLGRDRTLEEYQNYSGIDFKNRTVKDHTKAGVPCTG